jgi:hypothetical protein
MMKLFMTIALACVCNCANASSGMVFGTLTNTTGQPITVGSIRFTVNGVDESPVPVDNFGMYATLVTWTGNGPATCIVQTTAPGFIDQSKSVSVPAGGNDEADFVLAIDPDYVFSDDFEDAG